MTPLIIILAVVMIAGVGLVAFGMTRPAQTDAIGERLSQFTERTMTLDELELQQPFNQRVLIPAMRAILAQLGKYGPKQSAERLKLNLQQAGNPGNICAWVYWSCLGWTKGRPKRVVKNPPHRVDPANSRIFSGARAARAGTGELA